MAYVDWEYYSGDFGGKTPAAEFEELIGAAEDVVSALCPFKTLEQAEDASSAKKAVCYELDYIREQGGAAALLGGADVFAQKLELGDCKLTRSASGVRQLGGIPVSPLTLAQLQLAGLRRRWA